MADSNIMSCGRHVEGMETQILPVDMLEPFTKVIDVDKFLAVTKSMKDRGMLNPLVILIIDEDEWMEDCREQGDIIRQPSPWGPRLRYRVQCGNNRYWALKEYFPHVDAVECVVTDNKEQAYAWCKKFRGDKRWKRPTS